MANKNSILTSFISIITEEEIKKAQHAWSDGIVNIGKVRDDKEKYTEAAKHLISTLYGYDISTVLFKPTLASEHQFRKTPEEALSYFIGGMYKEDKGFALEPWANIRWENAGFINSETNLAIAMGNYYFTPKYPNEQGEIVILKVEYTFGYVKDLSGRVRIVAHKSSLPYDPEEE